MTAQWYPASSLCPSSLARGFAAWQVGALPETGERRGDEAGLQDGVQAGAQLAPATPLPGRGAASPPLPRPTLPHHILSVYARSHFLAARRPCHHVCFLLTRTLLPRPVPPRPALAAAAVPSPALPKVPVGEPQRAHALARCASVDQLCTRAAAPLACHRKQ